MSRTNRAILTSLDWPHQEPPEGYVRVDTGPGEHHFIRKSVLKPKPERKDKPVGEKKRNKRLADLITGKKSWNE